MPQPGYESQSRVLQRARFLTHLAARGARDLLQLALAKVALRDRRLMGVRWEGIVNRPMPRML